MTPIEETQKKNELAQIMTRELIARGYSDIEFIGISVELVRATAHATIKGVRHKLRIISPDNLTVARRPHFRITVLGTFEEVNGSIVFVD